MVLATDATLTAERVLTGTANQVILTDAGAGSTLTLSLPQSIATTSTPQFARLGLGAAADASTTMLNAGASVVSAPAHKMTGAWFTGGSATTTKPHFLIEPTGTTSTAWSTAGTGLGINAASGFAGNLIDLQIAGVNALKLTTAGGGTLTVPFSVVSGYLTVSTRLILSTDASDIVLGTANDLYIKRDAANTLAQRNGTAAQAFRVYNTYTDASNYERGLLGWTSNFLLLRAENAGTGIARSIGIHSKDLIEFSTGSASTSRWLIGNTGHLTAATDNTYDIGASGATRPRSGIFGTSVVAPVAALGIAAGVNTLFLNQWGYLYVSAPGVFLIKDHASDPTTYPATLQFSGTTSSFPSIKRSGVVLEAKLADGSAYTQFYGGTLRTGQYTVAGLPAAATAGAGATAYVTDSLTAFAAALGAAVVGGGSNKVTVFSDGTNWIVG